RRRWHRWRL
nr:Chain C, THE GLUCAGON RECEPTOR (GR) PEPTIDE [synthetic construct]3CZF_C Chain C, GLUCAGON RECEPTOR PEPTIDE [synthetic construct]